MIAFRDLQEILQTTIRWEKRLDDLYDVASMGLRNKDSKKTVAFLKERQVSNIEVLDNIEVTDFGPTEWVRFAADEKVEDLIPIKSINKNSTPKQIVEQILSFEEKLEQFYKKITDNLVTESQKELFDSLVRFKDEQIQRIRRFVESEL